MTNYAWKAGSGDSWATHQMGDLYTHGSVLFTGTTGSTPASGAGTRLMWIPEKAAFRAGEVQGNAWDTDNIGNYSFAVGYDVKASGDKSTAMGLYTEASGHASTAMGYRASTDGHIGSFVYGDNSTSATATTVFATADNQFMVRAAGGTIFYSNSGLTSGVSLAPGGGSWASVSDRHKKENFKAEDGEEVLRKIAGMPISSWNYRSQHPSIRHLGPTAQDFYSAFRLGESDTTITTTDIDGINILAIKALEKRTTELKAKVEELEKVRAELAEIKAENLEMKRKMAQFESTLHKLEALMGAKDR